MEDLVSGQEARCRRIAMVSKGRRTGGEEAPGSDTCARRCSRASALADSMSHLSHVKRNIRQQP